MTAPYTAEGLAAGVRARLRAYAGDTEREVEGVTTFEFAFPGPLRDKLVAAVLDGTKSATTGLLQDYEIDGEPLPDVGSRRRWSTPPGAGWHSSS